MERKLTRFDLYYALLVLCVRLEESFQLKSDPGVEPCVNETATLSI